MNTKFRDKKLKQHWHLVTAQIVYTEGDETTPFHIMQNAVIADDNVEISARIIGKAQQTVQLAYRQVQPDPNIKIIDVVLFPFSYLGYMTPEEFHKVPDGNKLTEMVNTVQ